MNSISPKQKNILQLIIDGWEIGIYTGIYPGAWIQKSGLGYGGEAKGVNFKTFDSLRTKGLIAQNNELPFTNPQHYHITQKGIEALI